MSTMDMHDVAAGTVADAMADAGTVGVAQSPLDADMFPHIMDAIVVSAPYSALLGLRGASRNLRSQCDAALAHHLTVEVTDPRFREPGKTYGGFAPVEVRARAGRVPHFRHWPYGVKLDPEESEEGRDGHDSDTDAGTDDDTATQQLSPRARLRYATASLASTRVLDIIGPVDPDYLAFLSRRIDSSRMTLRFRCNSAREAGSGEGLTVSTTGPAPDRRTAIIFTILHPENRHDFPVAPIGLVPDALGITKLVINVQFEPANPFLAIGAVDGFYYPEGVSEVVVIFTPRSAADMGLSVPELGKGRYISGNMRHPPGILDNVAYRMAPRLRDVRHTFVNLAAVPVMAFGLDPPAPPDNELYAFVREHIAAALRERRDDVWDGEVRADAWPDAEVEAAVDTVRFVTLEEYAASLDPHDFALEAIE